MFHLQALPADLFILTTEHLVAAIGIRKALRLRTVNKAFDTAILHAICISQVVDVDDPATPGLVSHIHPRLKGMIIAVKSRSSWRMNKRYVHVVAMVNQSLDNLIGETDARQKQSRHEEVAAAIIPVYSTNDVPLTAAIREQNLLSGAVVVGNVPIIRALLAGSHSIHDTADVNGATPYFHSPLTLAAARGCMETGRILLDHGARLDSIGSVSAERVELPSQAEWNNRDVYEQLRDMSSRSASSSPLSAAVFAGNTEILQTFLHPSRRLPLTSLAYLRAILVAARAGRLDLIELLFDTIGKRMSDFCQFDKQMMWAAVGGCQKEVVQMLLDHGTDVHAFSSRQGYERSTLSLAASMGKVDMIHFLMQRGADPNLPRDGEIGCLPIEAAALYGQEEVVELLIDRSPYLSRALFKATEGGQFRVIKWLLSKFPDLLHSWEYENITVGQLAVTNASIMGHLDVISFLVERGVSLSNGWGETETLPLNIAKERFQPWVAKHLISLGADGGAGEIAPCSEPPFCLKGLRMDERTWRWAGDY